MLLTVTEAEAASRGYALSGDVAYLKLHGEAALAIGPALLRLGRLIDDDAVQLQRFDRLSNLVERRLGVIRLLIETRRRDGVEAARTVVAGGEGKRLQDDIRALAGEMRTREKGLLQQRLAQSERSARMALAAVALGSLLAISIAALANYLIRRDFSGSRRAHAALREVNALLDRRVAERTAELQRANDRLQLADAVFRNTQESIVITDPETRVVAVNPAFSMVTEYPADEVIGQSVRLLRSGWHDESFYQQLWASLDATGNWQGEIWSRRRGGDVYQEWLSISTVHDAQGKLTHYIGVGVDLSRMNHAKTLLEHLAHHDALTGLPNRLLLHSRLEHSIERARRDKTLCAVLFIDLDRFKEVNDTLGHAAGDELLKLAAERMQLRLRDVDTLGRLGGRRVRRGAGAGGQRGGRGGGGRRPGRTTQFPVPALQRTPGSHRRQRRHQPLSPGRGALGRVARPGRRGPLFRQKRWPGPLVLRRPGPESFRPLYRRPGIPAGGRRSGQPRLSRLKTWVAVAR